MGLVILIDELCSVDCLCPLSCEDIPPFVYPAFKAEVGSAAGYGVV